MPDDLATRLVQLASAAIADAKYPGVKGAPGARPFPPRSYDERYGRAAVVAVLRTLADAYTITHGLRALADQIETSGGDHA